MIVGAWIFSAVCIAVVAWWLLREPTSEAVSSESWAGSGLRVAASPRVIPPPWTENTTYRGKLITEPEYERIVKDETPSWQKWREEERERSKKIGKALYPNSTPY